jgi:hypothetical protein
MAARTRQSETPVNRTDESRPRSAEDIATRAYHLYLERGAEHGRDVDDWMQAEREMTGPSSHNDEFLQES